MSATYTKDDRTRTIHMIDPNSPHYVFTFCGLPSDEEDEGGFEGTTHIGPATCADCKERFDQTREGMKGARWKLVPF